MGRVTFGFSALVFAWLSIATGLAAQANGRIPTTGHPTHSLWDALILGVVEGATEYLPVSSTGHLLLVQHVLGIGDVEGKPEASNALAICIQSGAILAVLVMYRGRMAQMLRGLFGRDQSGRRLIEHLLIAFFPSAVVGLLFHDWITENLFGVRPVAAALFVGGILILATANSLVRQRAKQGKGIAELTRRDCIIIGLAQCCALWPGVSRSLATILGALWIGVSLSAAIEFSFLLGLVTLSAATALEGVKHGSTIFAQYGWMFPLVSLVAAFVSAVLSIKFMIRLLSSYGLKPFGYYRIALAVICWFVIRS